ncbi:hypothetical protein GCG54_00005539 [Colletotrichum gloeosporioides]|uniref:Ecp2 effector protein domain-containing protein n=1 Tax=Colletotrichum gloeosporioides TaxID=474922 RepID=A0A8H4CCQ8_COLGL|nr:uncharacterized protein GCG54_00005539 [Colletotrichum gloeosporioides]KAF3801383.1 hypothetical protein GCG54_00005539 [Colletotrichum gloeosporioides]
MVNFALSAVATLAALAPLAAAAPTASAAPEVFSFVKWVDGIIANPHGDNLTPEEAVEAYYKSVNASEAAALDWDYGRARKRDDAAEEATPEWDYGKRDEVPEAAATPDWDYGRARKRDDATEAASPDWDYGRVRKRAKCNTIAGTQASVRFFTVADAVSCINYLAGLGSTSCVVSNAKSHFCTIGNAQITGVTSGSIPAASSCNDVARGAGYIMDACTLKDNTVQGSEFAYGNGDLLVWIRKPE